MKPPSTPADVLIVEDHPIVRLGLTHCLAGHPWLRKCGEADGEAAAIELVQRCTPHVVILDLTLRDGSGLGLIKRIRDQRFDARIVVSSMHAPDVYALRSRRAGAHAYVPKDDGIPALIRAIEAVASGAPAADPAHETDPVTGGLTDRELEVFRRVGKGHSTRAIAQDLHRSVKTIESFRARIKRKLDLLTSEELVRDAVRWVAEHDAA